MFPFGFRQIEGLAGWTFLLTFILGVLGLFDLKTVLFVGAVWGLALFFGKGHY